MNNQSKRLYRSETDVVIAGVCGGLAEYFDVDPVLVRILFVIFTLAGGSGILLYIILWLLMPPKSQVSRTTEENVKQGGEEIKKKVNDLTSGLKEGNNRSRQTWAIVTVGVGVFFLLSNFGLLNWFRLDMWWPVVLILLGIIVIFRR